MKMPLRDFRFLDEYETACYLDVTFYDVSPKGDMREWCITRELNGYKWTGLLRRSKTAASPFEYISSLPSRAASQLGALYEQIKEGSKP